MKKSNWIVLAISFLLSLFFLWLYFYLKFDLVDFPQGIVLSVIWWIVILGVGFALHANSRKGSKSANRTTIVSAIIVALLIPALVNLIVMPTSYVFASSDSRSPADAARAAETSDDDMRYFHYEFSENSQGAELYYSINGKGIERLLPGASFRANGTDSVEFFVKSEEGYLDTTSFLHSGNPSGFVPAETQGLYSPIGSNEMPGFADAVNEAEEIGCTKEFHYMASSFKNRYRQIAIIAEPVKVMVNYDLDGGSLDGKDSYSDPSIYYNSHVSEHPASNLITLPVAVPVKRGYEFMGWKIATDVDPLEPGATINVDSLWGYIEKSVRTDEITLPFVAEWKEGAIEPDEGDNESNGFESTSSSSSNTSPGASSGSSSAPSPSHASTASNTSTSSSSGMNPDSSSSSSAIPVAGSTNTGASNDTGNATTDAVTTNSSASSDSPSKPKHTTAVSMPGVVAHSSVFAPVAEPVANTLRATAYGAVDLIYGDGTPGWHGIAYSNRGCWVCYYMLAGIVLTLIYGVGLLLFRSARKQGAE